MRLPKGGIVFLVSAVGLCKFEFLFQHRCHWGFSPFRIIDTKPKVIGIALTRTFFKENRWKNGRQGNWDCHIIKSGMFTIPD